MNQIKESFSKVNRLKNFRMKLKDIKLKLDDNMKMFKIIENKWNNKLI